MDTCHYCEDIVEKLNLEYDSLYAENEEHKQQIESMYREILNLRNQMEFYETNNWYFSPVDRRVAIGNVFMYHDDVIYNNRTFDITNTNEERERWADDDLPPDFRPHSPPFYSAKEMMEKVQRSNRRNLWRSNPRLAHVA